MKKYLYISLLLLVANISTWATDVSNFVELKAALEDATETSVTLVDHITLTESITINGTKTLDFDIYTLSVNSYMLTVASDAVVTFNGVTGGVSKTISGGGACVVINGSAVFLGGRYISTGNQAIICNAGSNVTINGGYIKGGTRAVLLYGNNNFVMNSGHIDAVTYGVYAGYEDINITIRGGHISATSNSNNNAAAIYHSSSGNVFLSDSVYVTGKNGLYLTGGRLTIAGGTINGTINTINLSNYTSNTTDSRLITIAGGTFTGALGLSAKLQTQIGSQGGIIAGGVWDSDISDYCANGYIVLNEAGLYRVVCYPQIAVAQVDGQTYYGGYGLEIPGTMLYSTIDSAFQAAVSAAVHGETVSVLSDFTLCIPVLVEGTKSIDLNGHTISLYSGAYLDVLNGATLTFSGTGTINANINVLHVCGAVIINNGNFKTNLSGGVTVDCKDNGHVSVYGGTIDGRYTGIALCDNATALIEGGTIRGGVGIFLNNQSANQTSSCTINGGQVIGASTLGNGPCGVYVNANGELGDDSRAAYPNILTINGGSVKGMTSQGCGVLLLGKGATLNMTGGTLNANYYAISGNGYHSPTQSRRRNYGDTEINISGGVVSAPNNRVAMYLPQNGIVTISDSALIEGGAALAIKSGKLIHSGGTLHSTATGSLVASQNSGISISGAALQIETDTSYYGQMEILVKDSAKLTSDSWFAIYEYMDDVDGLETEVKNISVNGGKFVGGILVSKSLVNKGGFVKGGTWSEDVEAHCVMGKTTIPLDTSDPDYNPYYYRVVDQAVKEIRKPAIVVNDMANAAAIETKRTEMGRDTAILTNAADHIVVYKNADVVAVDGKSTVYAKKLTLKADTLFIRDGVTLNIGKGAIHIGDSVAPKVLIVEQGGTLVVDGLIYGAKDTTFMVHSSEAKSGVVLFSPETQFISEDHPEGTYRFTSKAFREAPTVVFQRFGMPVYNNEVTIRSLTADKGNSWYTWWDYDIKNWGIGEYFNNSISLTDVQPFAGYELSSNNVRTDTMQYDFIGKLMGNGNSALTYHKGWNYLANSYTGPISIAHYLNTVESEFPDKEVLASVYLYKDLGNDTYTWQAINAAVAGRTIWERVNGRMQQVTYPATIQPMQAFLMVNDVANSVYGSIIYEHDVYNPTLGISSTSAPTMRLTDETKLMQLSVYNNEGWDNVFLSEDTRFSSGIDNGYDAYKCPQNSGLSLYAMQGGDRRMEILANSTLSDTYIGISAPRTGTYTLFMANVDGFDYTIQDMETGTVIDLGEKREYTFTTLAGDNDSRFRIVPIRSLPTATDWVMSTIQIWVSDNTLFVSGNKGDDICVYSMGGQSVKQIAANGQSLQSVSLNDLATGVYMVRIADQTLSFIK